ncbi:MAG TPA: bacterioferritin-associated ferredoxin [Thiobacillaceae bacterium]|nr:bacterioferritin-associated ferredoxin [Thiobacillaceae bacterium]
MYVCICQQVTDRDIHQAVAQGARRMRDLREQLGVSSQCGKCAGCAKEVLQEPRKAFAQASCLQPA